MVSSISASETVAFMFQARGLDGVFYMSVTVNACETVAFMF